MTTYKDSGVDIELGDQCSHAAYQASIKTFASRKGMIGEPVVDQGGFSGAIDMGDYYLVQGCDTVGTKIVIAEHTGHYDGLGYDLLAMVADDAVCIGAETLSITNTIDADKVNAEKITAMMGSLEKACTEQKIAIVGGEIAESGPLLNGYTWGASSVGIIEKSKIIRPQESMKPGDTIIGLHSAGIRCNGFTLVRHILKEKFGDEWYNEKYDSSQTWGQATLTPSVVYSKTILALHGRHKEQPKVQLNGVAHITGGGIAGNLSRIFKQTGLGANLDQLPEVPEIMQKLMELGNVEKSEAYRTWNMGIGMAFVTPEPEKALEICAADGRLAQIIGTVTGTDGIQMSGV